MIKQIKKERDYLLDSSLISATFSQIENTKKLYNMKVVYCNDYIQLYTFNNDKFYKNKDFDDKKALNILNIDTDNLKINNYSDTSDIKGIEIKNIMRSKLQCQRLAKCNSNIWETFITLTFQKNVININVGNKEFKNFVRKIRRIYKDFKYLCVPEFQKRGAIHYHLLTNISIKNDKLIYKQIDNKKFLHIKYWNNGFTKVDNIKNDIKKIIGYISKYMTKDIDDRLFGKHRYFYSQNLNKPQISYLNLSDKKHCEFLINILNNKTLIYNNKYIDNFYNDEILFEEYFKCQ